MAGVIGQQINRPPGLPVNQMFSQVADARGASGQREEQSLRADFARRGQSGSAAEAAALRDLEGRTSGARSNDYRDLLAQDYLAQIQNRYQALGLGNSFLQGQQQNQNQGLQLLMGAHT